MFCFCLSSFCSIDESGIGSPPLLPHRDASCVDIHASLLYEVFHLIVIPLSSFCVFLSLCVAFAVVFALLVFLPGLYSAACRAAFLA